MNLSRCEETHRLDTEPPPESLDVRRGWRAGYTEDTLYDSILGSKSILLFSSIKANKCIGLLITISSLGSIRVRNISVADSAKLEISVNAFTFNVRPHRLMYDLCTKYHLL